MTGDRDGRSRSSVICSAFLKPNGYQQFNTAYIEIPKKQGKSELAAAVALLLLCGDGEECAEVYGCAAGIPLGAGRWLFTGGGCHITDTDREPGSHHFRACKGCRMSPCLLISGRVF